MLANETSKRILIVDPDVSSAEPLRLRLAEAGFEARSEHDGAKVVSILNARPPDLIILDWNVSGFLSLEIIRGVRKANLPNTMRVIIVSARASEQDMVAGLDLGADDYLAKPYSLREMVARVGALLRQRRQRSEPHDTVDVDDLVLESATGRVTAHGRALSLRGVEYRLLEFMMLHTGRSFTRDQLRQQVWGSDAEVDERTVDVNVQRLRKILAEPGYGAYIQTVRGFGYRFATP